MVKTNINVKHTFVTVAYMTSQKKNFSSNTKKTALVSIKTPQKINMPTEGKNHITLKNHQNQMPVPYVIYADFESITKPKTEKAGDKSELTSEHEACGLCWLVGCFGFNGPLRQYFSLYQAVIQRGRKKREKTDERKMSKHPPPAPTASAIGPCPTISQISRTPWH